MSGARAGSNPEMSATPLDGMCDQAQEFVFEWVCIAKTMGSDVHAVKQNNVS